MYHRTRCCYWNRKFASRYYWQLIITLLTISGVSAQSFIQAFNLAKTVFNVQLTSPMVRPFYSCWQDICTLSFICIFFFGGEGRGNWLLFGKKKLYYVIFPQRMLLKWVQFKLQVKQDRLCNLFAL